MNNWPCYFEPIASEYVTVGARWNKTPLAPPKVQEKEGLGIQQFTLRTC